MPVANVPLVEDRERDLARLPGLPGVRVRRAWVDGQTEPRRHPASERGHDAGAIADRRRQPPRAYQPRHGTPDERLEAGRRGSACDRLLDVRPPPRVVEVGKLVGADAQDGQRARRAQVAASCLHDDERDPRPQTSLGVGPRGSEQPRQLDGHELDRGQVVVLDVARAGWRVGADHDARVETRDALGSEHRQRRAGDRRDGSVRVGE